MGAKACCTAEGTCGSQSEFLFGDACIDRREERPVFVNNDFECPDEYVLYVDLIGCCMPSGECGLSVQYFSNWADVGCLPRARMRELLDSGSEMRAEVARPEGLSDLVLSRDDPATPRVEWSLDPIPCDPRRP